MQRTRFNAFILSSALHLLGVLVANGAAFQTVAAQDPNERYLLGLRQIQAEYLQKLWYPQTPRRPDESFRWSWIDAKMEQLEQLKTSGVDAGLLALVSEARVLSEEVSQTNQDYIAEVKKAGEKYREMYPGIILDPPDLFELIKPLRRGLVAEQRLNSLQQRCRTEEPDFARRWKVKLTAIATNRPALKPFVDDPDACSPLAAFSIPAVMFTEQELGTTYDKPYRLGDLIEPIEFNVESLPKSSWRYHYRFTLPEVSGRMQSVNVRVSSTRGYVHACFSKVDGKQIAFSSDRANASGGDSDQLQFPLEPGEQYLLTVYHVHKPVFGPQWQETAASIQLWRGDSPMSPGKFSLRTINLDQQKKWLEQERLTEIAAKQLLLQTTLATIATRPVFQGRYAEEGAVHPFTMRIQQFTASSKSIAGEIDWPSYGGTTRFRGQLVNTNSGVELNFKETDFAPGKASKKLLLGGEYRMRPELRDHRLVLRGDVRLAGRQHPLIMQSTAVDPNDPGAIQALNANPGPGTQAESGQLVKSPMKPMKKTDASSPTETLGTAAGTLPEFVQAVNRPASGLIHKPGEIHTFQGVSSYDGPLGLVFSKDGKSALATGDHIRAWDLTRGVQLLDHDQNSFYAAVTPNGSKTLFVGMVGSASHALFQMPLKKNAMPTHYGELERITALAVSRDGKAAVVSRNPGVLVFYDLIKNRKGAELPVNRDVTAMAFANVAATLLTGDDQNGIRIWNLNDGASLAGRFDGHGKSAAIKLITVSEDGKRVASASVPNPDVNQAGPMTLIIWDKESLQESHSVSLGQQATCLCLSPDWQYALVGEQSGEVGMYSIASGECLETLNGHNEHVSSVCFSPCWRFAATTAADDTVRLWGLEQTK